MDAAERSTDRARRPIERFADHVGHFLVVVGLLAVVFGVVGCLMSNAKFEYPLEPVARGIKTLSGSDYVLKPRQVEDVGAGGVGGSPGANGAGGSAGGSSANAAPQGTNTQTGGNAQATGNSQGATAKEEPLNGLGVFFFEVGRFFGYVFAFSATVWLLYSSVELMRDELKARRLIRSRKTVIALHGDSSLVTALKDDLKSQGKEAVVAGEARESLSEGRVPTAQALKAQKQVLLFEKDLDALRFLERHQGDMHEDADVYIRLDEVIFSGMVDEHIHPFSAAEVCAMRYWEDRPVTRGEQIVLVGSGGYAEALLDQGLVANIFDTAGGVTYWLIGNFSRWRSLHPGWRKALEVNGDKLEFLSGAWYDHAELLKSADRVILCGDGAENVLAASEMHGLPIKRLHIRADNAGSLRVVGSMPSGPGETEVFGTVEEFCSSALIMQDAAHRRGKVCDIVYGLGTDRCNGCAEYAFPRELDVPDGNKDDGLRFEALQKRISCMVGRGEGFSFEKCLHCDRFLRDWGEMDPFTRRSNYAVAAHDRQKARLLESCGIEARLLASHGIEAGNDPDLNSIREAYMRLDEAVRDELQKIEHIRWCRFHYLEGWDYGSGPKDPQARTHPDLLPYEELGDRDRSKNADSYLYAGLRIYRRGRGMLV